MNKCVQNDNDYALINWLNKGVDLLKEQHVAWLIGSSFLANSYLSRCLKVIVGHF